MIDGIELDLEALFASARERGCYVDEGYFVFPLIIGNARLHLIFISVKGSGKNPFCSNVCSSVEDELGSSSCLNEEIENVMDAADLCDPSLLKHEGKWWFVWAHPYEA